MIGREHRRRRLRRRHSRRRRHRRGRAAPRMQRRGRADAARLSEDGAARHRLLGNAREQQGPLHGLLQERGEAELQRAGAHLRVARDDDGRRRDAARADLLERLRARDAAGREVEVKEKQLEGGARVCGLARLGDGRLARVRLHGQVAGEAQHPRHGARVDLLVVDDEDVAASQQAGHSRQQRRDVDRLLHDGVHADARVLDAVGRVHVARDGDDVARHAPHVALPVADHGRGVGAAHAGRHLDVHRDDVEAAVLARREHVGVRRARRRRRLRQRVRLLDHLQRLGAVRGLVDAEAGLLECVREEFAQRRLVVHHQHVQLRQLRRQRPAPVRGARRRRRAHGALAVAPRCRGEHATHRRVQRAAHKDALVRAVVCGVAGAHAQLVGLGLALARDRGQSHADAVAHTAAGCRHLNVRGRLAEADRVEGRRRPPRHASRRRLRPQLAAALDGGSRRVRQRPAVRGRAIAGRGGRLCVRRAAALPRVESDHLLTAG
mmetsp:Transcript_2461/g.8358  ORF Transcript_2461/g.8358 Transcript_2461/m.8358 type:complete len:493 (-) Transcript_2461:2267-3745(-)